jgi:hypothetical protein
MILGPQNNLHRINDIAPLDPRQALRARHNDSMIEMIQ